MDYEDKMRNRSVVEVEEGMIFFLQDKVPNGKSGEFNKHFYLALGEPGELDCVQCFSITSGKNMPASARRYIPITVINGQTSYLDLNEMYSIHKSKFVIQNYRAIIRRCDIIPRHSFMKFVLNMFLYVHGLPTMVEDYILDMLYEEYVEAFNIKYADNFDRSDSTIILTGGGMQSKRLTYSPFANIAQIMDSSSKIEEKEEDIKVKITSSKKVGTKKTGKKRGPKSKKAPMKMSTWNPEKWTNEEILQYLDLKEKKSTQELMDLFGYAKGTIYSMSWKVQK